MIQVIGSKLSQWDVGRRVSVTDSNATHVHFANQGDSKAVIMEIQNGEVLIPDYLLQTGKQVMAYAVLDGVTLEKAVFFVHKRERPENYIYEHDDRNYIYDLIEELESAIDNAKYAVLHVEQALTEEQKKQARTNIGAVGLEEINNIPNDAVLYDKEQTLTEEQQARARENIGAADAETLAPLTEAQTIVSVNLYDPSLQTPETISPHFWVNGAPYSSTQFDRTYHCTAPIYVQPSTTYTVGVLLDNGTILKPWEDAGTGVQFFKADGTYISKTVENTFTTPSETAYFRMNYTHGLSVPLERLNSRCMLVLGSTLPDTYTAFGSYDTMSALDRLSQYSPPIQYHIDNKTLKVASNYSAEKDLLVTMNLGRGNGLFDFASFKLMPHGMDIESGEALADVILTNGTDWHAPFVVRATDNADGDDIESTYFTGGNHQYNNQGSGSTATARSLYVRFFANGREVVSEKGYANTIEIRWANNVQGYNTRKADGSGREILQERHRLIFDGVKWSETIDLEPLENVFIARWYGLQFVRSSVYPNYRYIGAVNRTLYTNEESNCGGKDADGIVAYGDKHRIEMTIDTSVDLGKRTLSGNTGALCSGAKAYMFIIDYKEMNAGEVYRLCGGYKFMSA